MEQISSYCANCLTRSLQIKNLCEDSTCEQFYLNDFVDISVKELADLAKSEELSGKVYGEQLIRSAGIKVMMSLQTMVPDYFALNKSIKTVCSTCSFMSLTQSGLTGITIRNLVNSTSSRTTLTSIKIKSATIGQHFLIVDDGAIKVEYPVTLTGLEQEIIINDYTSLSKNIRLYFNDSTVQLYAINCPTTSGCGCGGQKQQQNDFVIEGLYNGNASTTQYGFLPCVTTTCSYDHVICELARTNKSLIAYAMALQIGIAFYDRKIETTRLNETSLLGADINTLKEYRNMLAQKYDETIYGRLDGYGKPQRSGLKDIISSTISTTPDRCIRCASVNYQATPHV